MERFLRKKESLSHLEVTCEGRVGSVDNNLPLNINFAIK